MNSIRALAMQHIGHRVVVHSRMGIHHGILHHLDDNGMYLQLMNEYQMSSHDGHEVPAAVLGTPADVHPSLVWAPFFFVPWAAAYAFSPWGWWW